MNLRFGIRHEDKYKMERRAPLIPFHVGKMINDEKLEVVVESSPKRVFSDQEYINVGARVKNDLADCPVIFGIKEIPLHVFEEGKTYIFFSHVIKGQPYNMPMLQKMVEMKCNLIDYERVTDEFGKRMIFFGRHAGLAGMINSLWSLGQRLLEFGINTPFARIQQAHFYDSLEEAREIISSVGQEIIEKGLPEQLQPMVIGFTGYGNVSNGAQEIASLLPVKEILPAELLSLDQRRNLPANIIYKVVFKEQDMVVPLDKGTAFELQDYYHYPSKYTGIFEQYIPHLTVLMNCMYWDERYPRIVTKDFLEKIFSAGMPRMTVIGDITCDPDGSVECTHRGTEIEDPVFVYNPLNREHAMGFKGDGILIMAVDILPSELPRDASVSFSEILWEHVKAIVTADYSKHYDELDIPSHFKRALILHKGKFTKDYEYIEKYL